MLYDEDDFTVVKALLSEIADTKSKKIEELIDSASHANNEGPTSFLAGGIDALDAVVDMIREIEMELKAKRNEPQDGDDE